MKEKLRKRTSWLAGLIAVAAVIAVGVVAPASHSVAQALRIGGSAAHFGVHTLHGGFIPDPVRYNIVSGGSLNARSLGLPPNCTGFVSSQPDVILRYMSAGSFLRIYARGAGDTTLVINDPAGRWFCSDDEGGGLNPLINFNAPASGQYDIWVGSYGAGENIRGELVVTELRSSLP